MGRPAYVRSVVLLEVNVEGECVRKELLGPSLVVSRTSYTFVFPSKGVCSPMFQFRKKVLSLDVFVVVGICTKDTARFIM